jgi:hypothetical protein
VTTYVYETIPPSRGDKPLYYEIKQNMNDQPLMNHPDTGEPIRRVVLGGFGTLSSRVPVGSTSDEGCCGGSSCCG